MKNDTYKIAYNSSLGVMICIPSHANFDDKLRIYENSTGVRIGADDLNFLYDVHLTNDLRPGDKLWSYGNFEDKYGAHFKYAVTRSQDRERN